MNTIEVVIGANYGDEGKGLITDYLSDDNTTVVRFNGGAQASHTVEREGIRHAFRHFGSGSFTGAYTFLTGDFIVNPILYFQELKTLLPVLNFARPKLYVDPNCVITTPYDMMINQHLSKVQNKDSHGSCGLGINETLRRNEKYQEYSFRITDLYDNDVDYPNVIDRIRTEYVPMRLKELGLEYTDELKALVMNEDIKKAYIFDVHRFSIIISSTVMSFSEYFNIFRDKRKFVFEGAQGLGLCQHGGTWPNVTPSNTGLRNVIKELKNFTDIKLNINYITRAYTTRHGNGPLNSECALQDFENNRIIDATNIHNEFQGSLRFAPLDPDTIKKRIEFDLFDSMIKDVEFDYDVFLNITCLDQLDYYNVLVDDTVVRMDSSTFLEYIQKKFNLRFLSYGPNADSIQLYEGT